MIVDSMIVPECVFRPGSFTGLMTLYESNYIKLSQLITEFDSFPQAHAWSAVSFSNEDCDLYLAVKRRQPYTTTLKLTYLFSSERAGACQAPEPDPDLWVHVYHDARLVEAQRARQQIRQPVLGTLPGGDWGDLDWRWRNNMLLNKWLDYLLQKGHKFSAR